MLNPLSHSRTPADVDTYKVEPYVVAADVYAVPGNEGRGGWTWYTGSASWSYRVVLEGLLGFVKRGDCLRMDPCIPSEWDGFTLEYRYGATTYAIDVRNPKHVSRGVSGVSVDGIPATDGGVTLVDDGLRHSVTVVLGQLTAAPAAEVGAFLQ
jgi:cyclic beta-1,2-glucan synthetase